MPRPDPVAPVSPPVPDARLPALDGFRGLMTIAVVVSHYFAEVPNGIRALAFGWIAVEAFFVLSGFLVGRLLLDKIDRANFFTVFFVRRALRTLPVYVVCVALVFALNHAIAAPWTDAHEAFPLWSYLTFVQGGFMVATDSVGAHWLSPTWTLAVEEHFYLIVPALFLFVPRRRLAGALIAVIGATVLFRIFAITTGLIPKMAILALLPGIADVLACGILAAVLLRDHDMGPRWIAVLRQAPLPLLATTFALGALHRPSFDILAPLLVALAAGSYILAIAKGAPEAQTMDRRILRFFGSISYSVYLTHLAVLGILHGVILGSKPDLTDPAQWLVTLIALPATTLVAWVLTKIVEEPLTTYGRSFAWSEARRGAPIRDVPAPALTP